MWVWYQAPYVLYLNVGGIIMQWGLVYGIIRRGRLVNTSGGVA